MIMRGGIESYPTSASSMRVISEGSVRVDLVGGTLDLEPINLILPDVVTLNVATSLKAKVEIESDDKPGISIHSLDYQKEYFYPNDELTSENIIYSDKFAEMKFVLQIVHHFSIKSGIKITLSSGAPPGSGLGGSSAMGMTLYQALCQFTQIKMETRAAVQIVRGIEGRILNQGVPGYQDYYPAVEGGILALRGIPGGVEVEQLFSLELKQYLERHVSLFYSGVSRDSGINNWDVYKKFFDGEPTVRSAMEQIASISFEFYQQLKLKNYPAMRELIKKEGLARKQLAAAIVPDEILKIQAKLEAANIEAGIKMCGAGGGGCFIVVHAEDDREGIISLAKNMGCKPLLFQIEDPIL